MIENEERNAALGKVSLVPVSPPVRFEGAKIAFFFERAICDQFWVSGAQRCTSLTLREPKKNASLRACQSFDIGRCGIERSFFSWVLGGEGSFEKYRECPGAEFLLKFAHCILETRQKSF